MKKAYKFLSVLMVSILLIPLLSGCGSSPQNLLVGEWHDGWGEVWTFESGGTLIASSDGQSVSGRYSISRDDTLDITIFFLGANDYLSFTWVDNEDVSRYEWFVSENNLYLGSTGTFQRVR